MKCKYCGREYTKWRFCLECGSINHAYTNKNYIGEGDTEYCQDYLHVERPSIEIERYSLEAELRKKYGEQL